jgi:hypothetical protein
MLDPYQFTFVSLPCVSLISVVNIFIIQSIIIKMIRFNSFVRLSLQCTQYNTFQSLVWHTPICANYQHHPK